MSRPSKQYRRQRYPPQIISHALWLYYRFSLSFRDVEDLLAQQRFFRKLIKGQGGAPNRLVTDKLRSYPPAHRDVMPAVPHETHRYPNNRAEVSHQPTRLRERQMQRFKSPSRRSGSFRFTGSYRICSGSDAICCARRMPGCFETGRFQIGPW